MTYNIAEITEKAINKIKEHKLTSIEAVCSFCGVSKTWFYHHKLDENNALKDAIWDNKEKIKIELKHKWQDSDNATLQVGLYKLLSTEDEYHKLSGTRSEVHQTNDDLSKDDLNSLKREIRQLVKDNGFHE